MSEYRIVICASLNQGCEYIRLKECLSNILSAVNKDLPEEYQREFVFTIPDLLNQDPQVARMSYIDKIKAADLVIILPKKRGIIDDSVGYEMAIAKHFGKEILVLNDFS